MRRYLSSLSTALVQKCNFFSSMTSTAQPKCALERTIDAGEFFSADDRRILLETRDAFPLEMARLKNAYAVETAGSPPSLIVDGRPPQESPSQILYDQDFDEVNRTLVGVLALRWIHNNDYDAFTFCQPASTKLSRESFDWLRDYFATNLKSASDLFALILSMIINDLGKDPDLAEDYYFHTNENIADMNHDGILLEAANAGMIPSLDRLDKEHREDVILGLELGSELNAGQLAQAENVPINLEGLLMMKGHERAFALKFMEQILDIAGAAGHIDPTCAKRLIEPVFQAFKTVHEVSLDIIAGKSGLREGYDKVLTNRGDMLARRGFRRLTVHEPDQRALLRLLTMGRTADKEQAQLFSNAFDALDETNRKLLVQGLNVDGKMDETAVLPYYMPAIMSEGLENIQDLPESDKERAVTALMRYLARVLQHKSTMDEVDESSELRQIQRQQTGLPGIVIERNVRVARDTINSDRFRTNPESLDELPIPPGEVLKRRRTSHSL